MTINKIVTRQEKINEKTEEGRKPKASKNETRKTG
jgi:hypothetical protein